MKSARFFVTSVVLFATLGAIGCGGKKDKKKTDVGQLQSLREDGVVKWEQSEILTKDLAHNYRIMVLDYPQRLPSGQLIDSKMMGQKYNWGRLTLAERQAAKEKLAQFVTAISRLAERQGRLRTSRSRPVRCCTRAPR